MPTSFLEIVELPDGRIELRRAEDEGSLVTLDFSEDAKAFLQGQHVEVAKAMLSVGVQMAGRMVEGDLTRKKGRGFFIDPRQLSCSSYASVGFSILEKPARFKQRPNSSASAHPIECSGSGHRRLRAALPVVGAHCLRSGLSQLTTVWLRPRRKTSRASSSAL